MRGVFLVGRAGKLSSVSADQMWEIGLEVERPLGRAGTPKILEGPNDSRCAKVEAGVTVFYAFIERMRRPKPLGVKVRKGIRHDFFNGRPHLVGGPGHGQQRNVTSLLAHGCVRVESRGDSWVAAHGSQLAALKPSIG